MECEFLSFQCEKSPIKYLDVDRLLDLAPKLIDQMRRNFVHT